MNYTHFIIAPKSSVEDAMCPIDECDAFGTYAVKADGGLHYLGRTEEGKEVDDAILAAMVALPEVGDKWVYRHITESAHTDVGPVTVFELGDHVLSEIMSDELDDEEVFEDHPIESTGLRDGCIEAAERLVAQSTPRP